MAFNGDSGEDGPVAAINVTPLVDVMLVLLVIFMVTAPMMQQGVDVNLPKSKAGALKSTDDPLILSIDKDGQIFLGQGSSVPLEGIGEKVDAVLKARKQENQKVFIKADTGLDYGRVMAVMGNLHAAGVTQIGLISGGPDVTQDRGKK